MPSSPCRSARKIPPVLVLSYIILGAGVNRLTTASGASPPDGTVAGGVRDCNRNGVPDAVEVGAGEVEDCNSNGVPDDCEFCSAVGVGAHESGACCSPHAGRSCDCGACAASICAADPYCCDVGWDQVCAGSAIADPACPCAMGGFDPQMDCDADGALDECQPAGPWKGSALAFDGRGTHVTVGSNEGLRLDRAFTLEAWIKPTGPGSNSAGGGVIVSREGEYEVARFANGTIHFAIANGVPGWAWVATGYVAAEYAWTHFALVYDASLRSVRLLADGSEVFALTGNVGGVIHDDEPDLNEFWIGGRQVLSQFFEGQIDDVRIWNVARATTDIAADRYRWLRGDEPGLLGYWRFNEGKGELAHDRALGHPGTIVAARWVAAESCVVPADMDGNGNVDVSDFAEIVGCAYGPQWSTPPSGCLPDSFDAADLDRDGDVDLADLQRVLNKVVLAGDEP